MEAGTRGMPPAFDLYVTVVPRYPALTNAFQAVTGEHAGRVCAPSLAWSARLGIEYDGGGHRKDARKDKVRDRATFLARRTPTLRISRDSTKKSLEWRQFSEEAQAVRLWVDETIDAAGAVDARVAALVQAYEDEAVSVAALVAQVHDELLAGKVTEGTIRIGALRRQLEESSARRGGGRLALVLAHSANRLLYNASRVAATSLTPRLPLGTALLEPPAGRPRT